ncbi:MAG: hypothetical protein KatS3mg077_1249 [Candidatus Binatia bacterium]|nr:MAG: hypothetical protein KatS3mg077_1249 [Candidatus Binatia bacterium]
MGDRVDVGVNVNVCAGLGLQVALWVGVAEAVAQ